MGRELGGAEGERIKAEKVRGRKEIGIMRDRARISWERVG